VEMVETSDFKWEFGTINQVRESPGPWTIFKRGGQGMAAAVLRLLKTKKHERSASSCFYRDFGIAPRLSAGPVLIGGRLNTHDVCLANKY